MQADAFTVPTAPTSELLPLAPPPGTRLAIVAGGHEFPVVPGPGYQQVWDLVRREAAAGNLTHASAE